MNTYSTIDEYINQAPVSAQGLLSEVRKVISQAVPEAVEAISYGMPTFKYRKKNLIHFAGYKQHLGIYPTAADIESSYPEVAQYRTGKGTLQFSLEKSVPLELIANIARLRKQQIEQSAD